MTERHRHRKGCQARGRGRVCIVAHRDAFSQWSDSDKKCRKKAQKQKRKVSRLETPSDDTRWYGENGNREHGRYHNHNFGVPRHHESFGKALSECGWCARVCCVIRSITTRTAGAIDADWWSAGEHICAATDLSRQHQHRQVERGADRAETARRVVVSYLRCVFGKAHRQASKTAKKSLFAGLFMWTWRVGKRVHHVKTIIIKNRQNKKTT